MKVSWAKSSSSSTSRTIRASNRIMRRWYLSTSRSKALLSPFCARATKSVSTSLLFIVYPSVIAHYLGRPCPRTQQSHQGAPLLCGMVMPPTHHPARSEEHTSELQSRGHLVCRLLLEKKKKRNMPGKHR